MDNHIAVLLPHYNNCNGLKITLESLCHETETFTVFIIDDGSDDIDAVTQIINKFKNNFEINFKTNDLNKGITKTLNDGLKLIVEQKKFSLIARIDAGDLCLNDRFKHQKEFLNNNKDIALVGSWVKFVDEKRNQLFIFKSPSNPNKLKKDIYCYNPFIHPSIMFRAEILNKVGFYPEEYATLQDHAFFFKVIKYYKLSIVNQVLLEYEVNPNGISSIKRKSQAKNRIKLLLNEYKFELYPTVGLLRSFITYLMPQKILLFLKTNIFYK